MSETEKSARRETFDPKWTIILGGNDTGKSSLIKSIYQAFGAEPAKQNPRWKAADVKILLKFDIDGVGYQILRDGSYFAIFDAKSQFIKAFTRVTSELSPFLSDLFDFKLVLASREEEATTPPPAYLFLPFYMDQDSSWSNTWNAFSNLWQYTAWRDSLVEYHAGIRGNAYYQTSAEVINRRSEYNDALGSERGVERVMSKLLKDPQAPLFSLDPTSFSDSVRRLLGESTTLAETENTLKSKLTKLNGEAALQRSRLEIASAALGEISADFGYLAKLTTESIDCPTCGNTYHNDFAARFAVATDEDRVVEFIAHIKAEISHLEAQIATVYEEYSIARSQAERIQQILLEQQNDISLETIIESEGRRAADRLLGAQLEDAQSVRSDAEKKFKSATEELKGLDTKAISIRRERLEQYALTLRRNFAALDVSTYSQSVYQSLNPAIIETGSTLPRSLLAYQFAIFDLISKFTPATVCPLVIDSPNQQGQDGKHLPQILRFIAENQPDGCQLILGIETSLNIDFGGKTINTPTNKQSLLQKSSYADVHAEFSKLLKLSLQQS